MEQRTGGMFVTIELGASEHQHLDAVGRARMDPRVRLAGREEGRLGMNFVLRFRPSIQGFNLGNFRAPRGCVFWVKLIESVVLALYAGMEAPCPKHVPRRTHPMGQYP